MTRLYSVLCITAIFIALAAAGAAYAWLPERIPTHWNIHGQIDGYGSKLSILLMPAVMTAIFGLLLALPWLSPKHFELDSFRTTYGAISLAIIVFMGYMHGLMLWAALAGGFDITRALLAGLLLMFGFIGHSLTRVRRNFWVGVRTPWTLASEQVWDDTHRLASKLFVAAAVAGLAVVILPLPVPAILIAVLGLIMAAAVAPAIYSLIHYKRLQQRGKI